MANSVGPRISVNFLFYFGTFGTYIRCILSFFLFLLFFLQYFSTVRKFKEFTVDSIPWLTDDIIVGDEAKKQQSNSTKSSSSSSSSSDVENGQEDVENELPLFKTKETTGISTISLHPLNLT